VILHGLVIVSGEIMFINSAYLIWYCNTYRTKIVFI